MLPIKRQQQILLWLEKEQTLRISEISKRLDVSEMTVYRDIKPLIEQKKVLKTSKGISLQPKTPNSSNVCSYCLKPIHSRFAVQLIKSDQEIETACCAHCGLLRYQDIEQEVSQMICRDFLKDTTISAKMATFMMGTSLNLHCCEPQVIVFESMDEAKQFQKGFEGELYHFGNVIQAIQQKMSGRTCRHFEK
ncbi:DeoR family transcriptional regulator [Lederbergia sp. NSJ-179]|uniref:DeoR family transcriptional regulator n=1 Tax=Lederbergia sp. NSJ-179 TaxID=2931402 RepID=UPI0024564024